LHEGGALLGGVLTHGGSSYHLRGLEAIGRFAEQERALTVAAAERLRGAGLPCPVVSVGSTPTAIAARALPGVTEVRAGVYVFHDLVMHGLGVCALDEIALTVLATVIGHQADKGWVLIDAGWMALSRDRGTADHAVDQGFGLVCDEAGQPVDGGAWIVSATNQEHGTVTRRGSALAGADLRRRFPIGSRWRVLPIHACATAAQFDRYHLLGGASEGEVWPRFGGW
jgi:D-serine deaminase-like pyridoxal phosphate-dependent protein